MTLHIFQTLNKYSLYNMFPAALPGQPGRPAVRPLSGLLSSGADAPLTCSCCGWKGSEGKARKHYLEVEAIAELEFFCPDCNQYLGFATEQK